MSEYSFARIGRVTITALPWADFCSHYIPFDEPCLACAFHPFNRALYGWKWPGYFVHTFGRVLWLSVCALWWSMTHV
jgi:hypothetical protein